MQVSTEKTTRRGFVMTGGGAKGIYEAGVINALHLCGVEFDIITGSSIGAINALFYAEYLLHKRSLSDAIRNDPERTIEEMDNLIKAFHHAWLQLPEAGIIDDSDTGPLGQLKSDVLDWDIDIPLLVRLAWWYTNPRRWRVPPARVWPQIVKLLRESTERLGDASTLFAIYRDKEYPLVEGVLRAYLRRFGIEHALVPPEPNVLREFFVRPVTPLHPDHLDGGDGPAGGETFVLIDGERTMRDYAEHEIDLRLTRANYRTGRLELSTFTSAEAFIHFLESRDASKDITIGSTRLKVPGNPNAINAAIASGRFPGVFAPFAITDIYPIPTAPDAEPENALLYQILENGLDSSDVRQTLYGVYRDANPQMPDTAMTYLWDHLYDYWRTLPFPRTSDIYVDGGAIDNTPSNSAVDAVRETIERAGLGRRNVVLDLYVVFLHSEPNPGLVDIYDDPALYQVVRRTLQIQGAAKLTSDAGTVKAINHFGQRGEDLGQGLRLLLGALRDVLGGMADVLGDDLTEDQIARVQALLRQRLQAWFREQATTYNFGDTASGDLNELLETLDEWSANILNDQLPLHVNAVEIYPDEMQLDTLQFTERLGFREQNAIEALTMGCYNTFWKLRSNLEDKEAKGSLDELDRRSLDLARRWMGFSDWPSDMEELADRRAHWRCQRRACVFHARHCRHGTPAGERESARR